MNFRMRLSGALIFLSLCFSCSVLANTQSDSDQNQPAAPIVVIPSDVIAAFAHFTSSTNVQEITAFDKPGIWRDVVELVLLHQALYLGGYKGEIALSAEENYRRQLRRVDAGDALMIGATVWHEDAARFINLSLSEPMIQRHEYLVGLYTLPNNIRAQSVTKLSDVKDLVLVSHRGWSADWHAAQSMAPKRLDDSPNFESMFRMVQFGRADAALMAFRSNNDLSLQRYGVTLVPIPNIAVALPDSRHYVISRKHPMSHDFSHFLQLGLQKLNAAGTIDRAYAEAGVLNAHVQDWKVINPKRVSSMSVELGGE